MSVLVSFQSLDVVICSFLIYSHEYKCLWGLLMGFIKDPKIYDAQKNLFYIGQFLLVNFFSLSYIFSSIFPYMESMYICSIFPYMDSMLIYIEFCEAGLY